MLDNFEHLLEAAPIVTVLLDRCAAPARARDQPRAAETQTASISTRSPPLPQEDAVELFIERAAAVGADVADATARRGDLPAARLPPPRDRARCGSRPDAFTRRDARPARAATRRSSPAGPATEPNASARCAQRSSGATACSTRTSSGFRAAVRVPGRLHLRRRREGLRRLFDTLESLAEKSLLYARGDRFRMLQTIREYALECLLEREEADADRPADSPRCSAKMAESFAADAAAAEPPPLAASRPSSRTSGLRFAPRSLGRTTR